MFIGHFALGFAAKRVEPRVPLVALFAAAQFADLLWPVLVAVGVESVRIDPGNTAFTPLDFVSYPYSHSLVALVVWGLLFGLLVKQIVGGRFVLSLVAALVVSHWILDVLTHRPDMPLYPGGPRLGAGLWNSVVGTVAVELTLYAVGVWVYARTTEPRDRIGRWAFVSLVAFLLVAYAGAAAGGPPPSVQAVWITGIAGAVVIMGWSAWVDRHRAKSHV